MQWWTEIDLIGCILHQGSIEKRTEHGPKCSANAWWYCVNGPCTTCCNKVCERVWVTIEVKLPLTNLGRVQFDGLHFLSTSCTSARFSDCYTALSLSWEHQSVFASCKQGLPSERRTKGMGGLCVPEKVQHLFIWKGRTMLNSTFVRKQIQWTKMQMLTDRLRSLAGHMPKCFQSRSTARFREKDYRTVYV